MQTYDQQLVYCLPFKKISQLIVLQIGLILIVHHNFAYTVLRLQNKNISILAYGTLPSMCSNIKKYGRHQIIFQCQNMLYIFDWIQKQIIQTLSIPFSQIYKNVFGYFLGNNYLAFWKESYLNLQEGYNYEIDLYSRNGVPQVKKYKLELPNINRVAVIEGEQTAQIAVYEIRGFNIKIKFLNSNLTQQINFVFQLNLIEQWVDKQALHLGFSHNQIIPGSKLCYEIRSNSIQKFYDKLQSWNVIEFNKNYKIIHPNLFDSYSLPQCKITIQFNYSYTFKILLLANQAMKQKQQKIKQDQFQQNQKAQSFISQTFAQQIVNLIE